MKETDLNEFIEDLEDLLSLAGFDNYGWETRIEPQESEEPRTALFLVTFTKEVERRPSAEKKVYFRGEIKSCRGKSSDQMYYRWATSHDNDVFTPYRDTDFLHWFYLHL